MLKSPICFVWWVMASVVLAAERLTFATRGLMEGQALSVWLESWHWAFWRYFVTIHRLWSKIWCLQHCRRRESWLRCGCFLSGRTVFVLKKDSSPSPEGYSSYFFTATWHITSSLVVKVVQYFFLSGKLYRASNAYFLTLIPKTQSPKSFSDYRPISLLNFTNKIITKILTSKLS